MLSALNNFIVSCSKSWWKILLLSAGQFATLQALTAITSRFPALTAGDVPFDMQNSLKPEQIFSQLAGYSDEAFSSYYTFQAIDYLFPLFASLFLAAVATFALRHAFPLWYEQAVNRNLVVLMLLPAAFDYLENIFLFWAVASWPEQVELAAQLAVAAKLGKLTLMYASFLLTGLLLLTALGKWIGRRVRSA